MRDMDKELLDRVDQQTALDQKLAELKTKKTAIEHKKVVLQYEKMTNEEENLRKMESFDFGRVDQGELEKVAKSSDDYIDAAKTRLEFILPDFDNIVPFFRKNLILIGATTGSGKSTCVSNIVRNIIRQRRPDGTQRRALVLTNEECAEDFYNRVTSLVKGWNYNNHDKITEDRKVEYSKFIRLFGGHGVLNVIGNTYSGMDGVTTSIEGIQMVFDSILKSQNHYDVILIDYYQNVKYSKTDPTLDEWKVQAKLANLLDNYKNVLPCPIVIMAQVEEETEVAKKPFGNRIKGRKVITDPATLIMEIQREASESRTKWIVHKSRFTESIGVEMYTGFTRGRYIPYDDEFKKKVIEAREMRLRVEMDRQTGKSINERAKDEKRSTDSTTENAGSDAKSDRSNHGNAQPATGATDPASGK